MRDKSQVVLPIDLGICIDKEDFVFTLEEICESLNYDKLFEKYVRRWRKLNPITMFEIVLFAYILKQDFGFKRFLMRGKRNVETQFFLLAIAFNIEKLCNKKKFGRFGQDLFQLKAG